VVDLRDTIILLIIIMLCSISLQSIISSEGFDLNEREFSYIDEVPGGSGISISSCWDPHSNQFLIAGGNESSKSYRLILSTNGTGMKIINESSGGPFIDISVNPVRNYSLISDVDGALWKLENGKIERIPFNNTETIHEIIWEPEGRYALLGGESSIWKYTDDNITRLDSSGKGFTSGVWSNIEESFIFVSWRSDEIGFYNGSVFRNVSIPEEYRLYQVSLDPNTGHAYFMGRWLVYSYNFVLFHYNGNGLEEIETIMSVQSSSMIWIPDGSYAVINIMYDGKPMVFSNGKITESDIDLNISLLGCSPDGMITVGYCKTYHSPMQLYGSIILDEKPDRDGDHIPDESDDFPDDPSEWKDSDRDGVGDNTDRFPDDPGEWLDGDNDTVGDNSDVFPDDPDEWKDTDGDGFGDNTDVFPHDPEEWSDSDGDGRGDNEDRFPDDSVEWMDSDNDSIGDIQDRFPHDPDEWKDTDGDGIGDNTDAFPEDASASLDSDNDGFPDIWNPGKDRSDSVTGLILDDDPVVPFEDPDDSKEKDDDQDWLPLMIMAILSILFISVFGFVIFKGIRGRKS
jgi:hypothetical protein